uniref:Uncharacterized protein n=1 Tax=Setaria italica TaxID=4555 RepID=K3Z9V2_SETIT
MSTSDARAGTQVAGVLALVAAVGPRAPSRHAVCGPHRGLAVLRVLRILWAFVPMLRVGLTVAALAPPRHRCAAAWVATCPPWGHEFVPPRLLMSPVLHLRMTLYFGAFCRATKVPSPTRGEVLHFRTVCPSLSCHDLRFSSAEFLPLLALALSSPLLAWLALVANFLLHSPLGNSPPSACCSALNLLASCLAFR